MHAGYREELYSRLEIKRILQDHAKPRRPRLKQAKTIPAKQVYIYFEKVVISRYLSFYVIKSNTDFFSKDYVTRTTLHKPQMKRRHKRKSPSSHLVAPTKHYSTYKGNNVRLSEQSKVEDNPDLCYLNPRFNFKDALEDINKRLTSQTSFWISLVKDLR